MKRKKKEKIHPRLKLGLVIFLLSQKARNQYLSFSTKGDAEEVSCSLSPET